MLDTDDLFCPRLAGVKDLWPQEGLSFLMMRRRIITGSNKLAVLTNPTNLPKGGFHVVLPTIFRD